MLTGLMRHHKRRFALIGVMVLILPLSVTGGDVTADTEQGYSGVYPFADKSSQDEVSESEGFWLNAAPDMDQGEPVAVGLEPGATTEALDLIGATAWHDAGYTGAGVKVGILSPGFAGYEGLLGSELPDTVTTHWSSIVGGSGSSTSGTRLAEIVHDVAPGADLYMANFSSSSPLSEWQAAIDWFIAQGIDLVVESGGFIGSGASPLNGSTAYCAKVSEARAAGVLFCQPTCDQALRHWSGPFVDTDEDDCLEFVAGVDEGNNIYATEGTVIYLSLWWDDPWGASSNDYDLVLFDEEWVELDSSERSQDGDDDPWEQIVFEAPWTGWYKVAVFSYESDHSACFDLFSYHHELERRVSTGSLVTPGDSAAALTVGAVPWNSPTSLEPYSSCGPTGDYRMKPNLVAPDGTTTTVGAWHTTNAAAAHVAGAAALVKQAFPSYQADGIQTYLEKNAVDLGEPGQDNLYGSGRLFLPAPLMDSLINQYAPHLCFHDDELYFPTEFLFDDEDITNNLSNYGRDPVDWPEVAYTHMVMSDENLCIQYWFYYVNDRKYLKENLLVYAHHHDWECVFVFLRRQGSEYVPEKVTFFGHNDHQTFGWDHPRLTKAGTHPIVYVAKLSHASFPNVFGTPLFPGGDPPYNAWPWYEPVGFAGLLSMNKVLVDYVDLHEWPLDFDSPGNHLASPWNRPDWDDPWHLLDEPWGVPPPTNPLSLILYSPVNPLFVDGSGRRVGLDPTSGSEVNEIPGAVYSGAASEPQVIVIPDAGEGEHSVSLSGTVAGVYSMEVELHTDAARVVKATRIPVTDGATHEYSMDWDVMAEGGPSVTIEKDTDGDGEFDETVVTTPPNTPSNPSPADETNFTIRNVTLEWTGGDPDAGETVTYDVYFGTDTNPPLIAQDLPHCTYEVGTIDYCDDFYWRVAARDNNGVTSEGPLWGFSTALLIDLQNGWNMVSVPVQADDMSTGTIFAGSVAVYTWDPDSKSYTSPDTIDPKCGYWVAVTEPKTITVTGTPVTTWTDSLLIGWNMIGSVLYEAPVSTDYLTTDADPDPLLRNAIYRWNPSNKSYESVTTVQPGEGYWLATSADCQLTLYPPP